MTFPDTEDDMEAISLAITLPFFSNWLPAAVYITFFPSMTSMSEAAPGVAAVA
jgi:hypothetical protein